MTLAIPAVIALLLLPHVALGFVLGRTASIRGFILEAGAILSLGLLVLLGWIPGIGKGATAEALMGLYGVVGAALPFVGLGYALGVVLRWPLKLPKEGYLWRLKRGNP